MRIADALTVAGIAKDILVASLHVKNDDLIKKGFAVISDEITSFVEKNSKEN